MSACTDSPRCGRIGCGQTYSGETQHCVARASWSTRPDGRVHITAARSVIDRLWSKGGTEPADPATLGYEQDERGRWRMPMTDAERAEVAAIRGAA